MMSSNIIKTKRSSGAAGVAADQDLIKLTDSPMFRKDGGGSSCVTGVLVDLTEDDNEGNDKRGSTYPQELLRIGEFDDTFGLYVNNQRRNGDDDSEGVSSRMEGEGRSYEEGGRKLSGQDKIKKISVVESQESMPRDVFSPVPVVNKDHFKDLSYKKGITEEEIKNIPTTPTKSALEEAAASATVPVTPVVSESDSFLDVNNLSAFSVSSDDLDDAFLDNNKCSYLLSPLKKLKLSDSDNKRQHEQDDALLSRGVVGGFRGTTSERSAANLGRLQRRNSIVEKMQRLNDIINSPMRTPPTSRLNCLSTPARRNQLVMTTTSDQQQGLQGPATVAAFSSYSTSNSDGGYGNSSTAISSLLPLQLPVSVTTSSLVQNQTDDLNNVKPFGVVRPTVISQPPVPASPVQSDCGMSDVSETCAIKRLSFTSTASSNASPPSVKLKTSVFDPTRIKQAPTSFSAMGTAKPKQENKFFQPLKAFAPSAPSAPTITTTTGKRQICSSAPVTRKFMAPEPVNISPSKLKIQTTPRRNSISSHTPSKSIGRPSFANVRSSGYGPQPSPSAKNTRTIPPSPAAATGRNMVTPKAAEKNMTRSRILKPSKEDEPIQVKANLLDREAIPKLTSGIRKINFSSVGKSKENIQPKESKLPNRLGFVRK